MPAGNPGRLSKRALWRHLAAYALPEQPALPGNRPLQPQPAVRRGAPSAMRQPQAARTPARLCAPTDRLAAAGLRPAPGTAQGNTSTQPAACRRTPGRRPTDRPPQPLTPRLVSDSAGSGPANCRAADPEARPAFTRQHPRSVAGGELCATGRLAGTGRTYPLEGLAGADAKKPHISRAKRDFRQAGWTHPARVNNYFNSLELLPSSRRATISNWIRWVPSKMSRIFESRDHFSNSSSSP